MKTFLCVFLSPVSSERCKYNLVKHFFSSPPLHDTFIIAV